MKLLFFDDFKLGVLNGDNVVDVSDVVREIPQLEPQDVIRGLDRTVRRVTRARSSRPRARAAACR